MYTYLLTISIHDVLTFCREHGVAVRVLRLALDVAALAGRGERHLDLLGAVVLDPHRPAVGGLGEPQGRRAADAPHPHLATLDPHRAVDGGGCRSAADRKSTRLNSSH